MKVIQTILRTDPKMLFWQNSESERMPLLFSLLEWSICCNSPIDDDFFTELLLRCKSEGLKEVLDWYDIPEEMTSYVYTFLGNPLEDIKYELTGDTALHRLLRVEREGVVHGINIERVYRVLVEGPRALRVHNTESGFLPLHLACSNKCIPEMEDGMCLIEELITRYPVGLRTQCILGNNPLHEACKITNHSVIDLLLRNSDKGILCMRNRHNLEPIFVAMRNHISSSALAEIEILFARRVHELKSLLA